jgi:tetratricopeptide (TPR) repeat protein
MTNAKRALISLAIVAPLLGGLVYVIRMNKASEPVIQPQSGGAAAPSDAVHELASLEEERKKNPKHVPILLRVAELHKSTGKMNEALAALKEAAAAEPDNADAALELGRMLFKNADALYNLGAIFGNMGNDAMARDYFQKAVAANPESESAKKANAGLAELAKGPAPVAGGAPSRKDLLPILMNKDGKLPSGHPPVPAGHPPIPPGHPPVGAVHPPAAK